MSFEFPRVILQEKENVPCDFLIDEIEEDFYFFHTILNIHVVQNRVLLLNKGLFREFYSIKKIAFESSIEYQSYKFRAELHLTRKEISFILDFLM